MIDYSLQVSMTADSYSPLSFCCEALSYPSLEQDAWLPYPTLAFPSSFKATKSCAGRRPHTLISL